jgi:membrane-associated protein
MHNLLNPTYLVKHYGYIGVFLTIFLESGVIVGFFLPGDSLLFAAGLLASQHDLSIFALIIVAVLAAIIGNTAGFFTGRQLGTTLFTRKDSLMFSKKRVTEAHAFFEKEGPQSRILARFIPAVRCFVPIIAGVAGMDYRSFFTYNSIGGLLWGIVVPILGYTLGKTVPNIDKYLLPIIILIAALSMLPLFIKYIRAKRKPTELSSPSD